MYCFDVVCFFFFFFNDTATTEIYTLSLHDALPICVAGCVVAINAILPDMRPSLGKGVPPAAIWKSHPDSNRQRTPCCSNCEHLHILSAPFVSYRPAIRQRTTASHLNPVCPPRRDTGVGDLNKMKARVADGCDQARRLRYVMGSRNLNASHTRMAVLQANAFHCHASARGWPRG